MKAYRAIVTAILLPIAVMQAAERQVLHGHVPLAVANARVLGRVSPSEHLNLAIGLPLRNQEGLDLLLQQLYDPASPNYHQYQKPEEFAAQFGPTEHDYQALIRFAESNGLVVTGTHPNRTILDVSGAVADIEQVFHLNMMSYWHPVRGTFYAPDREPSVDLDVRVLDISGLDNFELPRPMGLKTMPLDATTPFVTGSGPAGFFIGGDFRAAYAPGVTLNGTGQVVGLLEFDSFYASDVQANFKQAGLPAVPTQMVLLDGVSGIPGGANIEVILDIMMASYMAPGLSKVMVYEGSTPNDILNRMATDNLAQQLSSSWGYSPINATTEQIFKQYIAQGQSLLQASGDSGAYEGGVMPPSDDPNLTVVGGTSLTTSGAGGPWQSEVTWPGSGGGVSITYPIPSYQQGTNMAVNGGSSTMRNIPDIALTADIQMFLICNNGQGVSVGGTSAAAPLWAGFIALTNQQALAGGKPSVGFLNPLIYSIGNGSSYSADFHDITLGNNYGFSAMSGYDLATGWGTPAGQPLIDDLSGALAAPAFTLSASPLTLSISPGSSGVSTLTVGMENGFSGSVTLAASGMPKGVTASFSPASTAGTSTLTLVAASSAIAGTATVTVTGTSGVLKSTATIILTITTPNFGLTASPGSIIVAQGNSGVSTLAVGPQNGFSGSVTLAATGLPKGVTASFSPASTTGTSTLTLVAASSATAGTATVTVTGTSGVLKSTATIVLTITAPNFSLSVSPSSLILAQGNSGVSTLTVGPQNGFSGSVSLAASGLPKGVTASFSPASTPGTSILTLVAASSATAGTATVTITGTSGVLKSTATISLTITAPNFSLTVSPSSLNVVQGNSVVSTLTVGPQNGFSGIVSLVASGLPKGVTASFSPASTTATSTLTLVAGSSVVAGTATVTVTGISGSLSHTGTISLVVTVPSFSLSASPGNLNVVQGNSVVSTLTVGPQNGFNGIVNLVASGLPKGVTASFSPASTTGTSTLTLVAGSAVVAGTATVTVTGTSGGLTHTTTISLVITVPNFSLSALPGSLGVVQGNSVVSTLTVGPQNGFSGNVSLAASGLPKGVTASFSPASTTGTSTLTLAAGSVVTAGTATVTVTGTSGSLTHTTTISLVITVPNFSLSASPSNLNVVQGNSVVSTLTVGPQSGFNGSVTLAASGLPSGVTASFSPASTTGTSTLTLVAGSAVTAGTTTVTVTGTSGSLTHTATISLVTTVPNFSLSASPSSLGVAQGSSGVSTVTVGPQSGFSGSVSLAVSGLPSGVTASFSPASTTGASTLTLAAGTAAAAGTATVTVTASSGTLSHTTTIGLTVIAPSAGATLVNLASAFNVSGIVTDGTAFTTGGLDGGSNGVGEAYSANLLGAQKTVNGTTFYFGPANAPDAVSSRTILLPLGQFSTLQLLATAVNGSQLSQSFAVTYADGTTSSFTQSLSDWFSPQNFAGESKAVTMAYRDTSSGARDSRTFLLYGYSFLLSAGKQVSSITLPNNRNVVVLAMSLTGSGTSSPTAPMAAQVSLSPAFNITGISTDGETFTGGLDGVGYAYSETLLGATQTFDNTLFNIGPANSPDAVSANGNSVGLPAGQFSALRMLATGVNGSQTAQSFTVTYSDGTSADFTQSLSDWFKPQNFAGESMAVTMARRNSNLGLPNNGPFYLYGYSFNLNNSKTVSSITLPGNSNVKVFALTLVP